VGYDFNLLWEEFLCYPGTVREFFIHKGCPQTYDHPKVRGWAKEKKARTNGLPAPIIKPRLPAPIYSKRVIDIAEDLLEAKVKCLKVAVSLLDRARVEDDLRIAAGTVKIVYEMVKTELGEPLAPKISVTQNNLTQNNTAKNSVMERFEQLKVEAEEVS
jgi:hypothetical protein